MKAVLVFCEGYHDVVFAQRSLGAHGGCEWVGRPIRELPTPFGSNKVARKAFIARRLEPHALEDLAIRDAAHPPLPCFESIVENAATRTMFFVVRAHGKTQTAPVLDLLRSLDDTIDQPPRHVRRVQIRGSISVRCGRGRRDGDVGGISPSLRCALRRPFESRTRRVARGYQDSRRLFRLPQRDARPDRHDRGSSGTDGGTRLARSVRRGPHVHHHRPNRNSARAIRGIAYEWRNSPNS